MEISIQQMLFEFLGGLGIFLFGIKFMGDGLQKSAGDRLRDLLDKYTTNPIMGILVGILVTVLIQRLNTEQEDTKSAKKFKKHLLNTYFHDLHLKILF